MAVVICNGNPKAGLHALLRTVELLGIPLDVTGQGKTGHCIGGHWPLSNPPLVGKHIHIIRNPRNMLVSWTRFTRGDFAPGFLISAFKSYYLKKPIYEEFMDYVPYLRRKGILTVRFEGLAEGDGDTAESIAAFIGTPMLPGVIERRLGGTITWTGKLSIWEDYWSDAIEEAWVEARGLEIEKAFGYG